MTPPPDEPPYTRRDKRVHLDANVSMAFEEKRNLTKEQTLNLSVGGMFVESESNQAVGSLAQFEIRVEGESQPIEGVGEVVWVRREVDGAGRPAGMGVRFLALEPRSRDKIETLLVQQDAQNAPHPETTASVEEEKGKEAPSRDPFVPGKNWPSADGTWPWLETSGSESSSPEPPETGSSGVLTESGLYYSAGRPSRPWWRIPLIIGIVLILLGVGIAVVEHFLNPRSESGDSPRPVERPTATATQKSESPAPSFAGTAGAAVAGPKLPSTSDSMTVTAAAPKVLPSSVTSTPQGPLKKLASPNPRTPTSPGVGEPRVSAASVSEGSSSPAVDQSAKVIHAAPTARAATQILKIDWTSSRSATTVTIHADGTFASGSYDVMRLGGPKPRLVVRLRGIEKPYSPAALTIGSPELERIRSGLHRTGMGPELHLVFDLSDSTVDLDRIQAGGEQLRLLFDHGKQSRGRG